MLQSSSFSSVYFPYLTPFVLVPVLTASPGPAFVELGGFGRPGLSASPSPLANYRFGSGHLPMQNLICFSFKRSERNIVLEGWQSQFVYEFVCGHF